VVILAKRLGRVAQARPIIEDLRRAGLFVTDAVIADALKRAGDPAAPARADDCPSPRTRRLGASRSEGDALIRKHSRRTGRLHDRIPGPRRRSHRYRTRHSHQPRHPHL
jgi:hypothetical protein